MTKTIRTICPEVRVINEAQGLVDYVASDETVDSYREIIRASGWRFTHFRKNAPFLDSHSHYGIGALLGRVTDFKVEGGKLVERVQWAIDVENHELAQLGFKMTVAGYLKAVSVGFFPKRMVTKWDQDPGQYNAQLAELKLDATHNIRAIHLEQEQVELSACVIGANPNALAKAYKAGAVTEEEVELFGREVASQRIFQTDEDTARRASDPAQALRAREQGLKRVLEEIQALINTK